MALKTASQQQFVSAREHFRQLITNKGKPADPSLGARLGKTELTLNLISRWVVVGRGGRGGRVQPGGRGVRGDALFRLL